MLLWKQFWQEMMNSLVTKMCVFIKWPVAASIQQSVESYIIGMSAGHQFSGKMYGICITRLGVEL